MNLCLDAGGDQFSGEVLGPIAAAIVREHPLDGDAVAGEERPGPTPEGDGSGASFVGMDLGVGQAAVGVDGRVDVGITEAGSTGLDRCPDDPPSRSPANRRPWGSWPAFSRPHGPVRPDGWSRSGGRPGRPCGRGPRAGVTPCRWQYPVEGRGGHAEPRAARRAGPSWWRRRSSTTRRSTCGPSVLVGQRRGRLERSSRPAIPGLQVAPPPLVGRLTGDPHGFCRCGDGPTVLVNQLAQTKSTFRGEWSVTVHGEPSWLCGCVNSYLDKFPEGHGRIGGMPTPEGVSHGTWIQQATLPARLRPPGLVREGPLRSHSSDQCRGTRQHHQTSKRSSSRPTSWPSRRVHPETYLESWSTKNSARRSPVGPKRWASPWPCPSSDRVRTNSSSSTGPSSVSTSSRSIPRSSRSWFATTPRGRPT